MWLKKTLIILLILFRGNIIAQATSIKQFSFDLVSESLPNIVPLRTIEVEKKPILFYLIVSKNLCFRHKENILEIKLFSREIAYRASYNYNIKPGLIDSYYLCVDDFNLKNLKLTHEHVYDLLSISYGKEYKVKGSSINYYKRINIGFAINFPGEFYYEYLWIHPINLKAAKREWEPLSSPFPYSKYNIRVYDQYFSLINHTGSNNTAFNNTEKKHFYTVVFNSTNISQWAVNILIGLIENIFVEYSFVVPICHFLILCPLHIHISIGTILGTIEWLYRYFKEEDGRGFLSYFYTLFCMQSLCELKIGYYE